MEHGGGGIMLWVFVPSAETEKLVKIFIKSEEINTDSASLLQRLKMPLVQLETF